jgi:hypothetical protein
MCALRIAHLVDVHGRFDAVADATGAIVGGRCAAHRRRYHHRRRAGSGGGRNRALAAAGAAAVGGGRQYGFPGDRRAPLGTRRGARRPGLSARVGRGLRRLRRSALRCAPVRAATSPARPTARRRPVFASVQKGACEPSSLVALRAGRGTDERRTPRQRPIVGLLQRVAPAPAARPAAAPERGHHRSEAARRLHVGRGTWEGRG